MTTQAPASLELLDNSGHVFFTKSMPGFDRYDEAVEQAQSELKQRGARYAKLRFFKPEFRYGEHVGFSLLKLKTIEG